MLASTRDQKNETDAANLEQLESGRAPFTFSSLYRYRWNVLDLLDLFGKQAITAHLFCDIDMSKVEEQRHIMNDQHYPGSEIHHVTATAFLLKAISLAQKDFPESRSFFLPDGKLATYENIVAGFTIEREVKGKPVVFFGEIEQPCEKSVLEIADELRASASADLMSVKKLREQKIFAEMPWLLRRLILTIGACFPACRLLCMKATFGLSSLGALGVSIACGPSVCTSVFGVGAVQKRAVVVADQIVIKPMLSLALCYDQRAMDGGQAARFINKVRMIIEEGLV